MDHNPQTADRQTDKLAAALEQVRSGRNAGAAAVLAAMTPRELDDAEHFVRRLRSLIHVEQSTRYHAARPAPAEGCER